VKDLRIFAARPAVVVDSLPANVKSEDLDGKEMDRLSLTWEQRRWMRGRFTTEKGREIGVALPTGIHIERGQVMWIGPDWYLIMDAACEPLLAIQIADRQEAIRIAFEVGNLHFPLAAAGEKLMVPDDPAMIQLLGRMGVRWENCSLAFEPLGRGNPHER
jgi:urease accessory protein